MAAKKKFFELELPIIKQKVELYGTSEDDLEGRSVKIDLTRKLRGKGVEIIFKVIKDKEKLNVIPSRLHLFSYYIRRMMRKSVDYVEDSFDVESKNAHLRVKPFLITRKKVTRNVRKALRNKAKEEIIKSFGNKNFEDIFDELISNRFQRNLSLKLKKIYPLGFCDIRDIYLKEKKDMVKKVKVK